MTEKTFTKVQVGCCLLESGRARPYTPGTKPERGPVWDKDLCVRCALCYLYCPDAAISRQADGYFDVNVNLCKGCGICHRECWFGAISMQEVDSWIISVFMQDSSCRIGNTLRPRGTMPAAVAE